MKTWVLLYMIIQDGVILASHWVWLYNRESGVRPVAVLEG